MKEWSKFFTPFVDDMAFLSTSKNTVGTKGFRVGEYAPFRFPQMLGVNADDLILALDYCLVDIEFISACLGYVFLSVCKCGYVKLIP